MSGSIEIKRDETEGFIIAESCSTMDQTDPKHITELIEGNETASMLNVEDTVDDFGFGAVAKIVSTEDDPTLPLLTFRFFVLSTILSVFGGILGQIFFFKPQTLTISALFH
ncbi:hypothetical protein HDU79_002465, partial [Rhizoclosmatium sp. JEL0117]